MNLKVAITFVVIGLISGWAANKLMGERDTGLSRSLGIGVLGALLGGFVTQIMGVHSTGFLGHLVIALGGSVALLYLLRQLR